MEAERAEKEKALAIAKKMKKDGLDDATIKKYTGLRITEVRKL